MQRVRLAAVLAVGAFALHQLRYLLAFGGSSSAELARQGHGYMADALPAIAVLGLAVVLATLISARLRETVITGGLIQRGALFALTLMAIYVTQESLEGILAAGHPGGVSAVLGSGGWIAGPLALCLGFVVALLIRALERVEVLLAPSRVRRVCDRPPRDVGRPRPPAARMRFLDPLAVGIASRPPPLIPA